MKTRQLTTIILAIAVITTIFTATANSYQKSAKYGCWTNDNQTYYCPKATTVRDKQITFYTPITCYILNSSVQCSSDCGQYVDYGCYAYISFEEAFKVNTCEKKYTNETLGEDVNCKDTLINPTDLHLTAVNVNEIDYSKCTQRVNESVLVIECPQYNGKTAQAILQTTDAEMFDIIDFKTQPSLIDLITQNLIYLILLAVIIILAKTNFIKPSKMKKSKKRKS